MLLVGGCGILSCQVLSERRMPRVSVLWAPAGGEKPLATNQSPLPRLVLPNLELRSWGQRGPVAPPLGPAVTPGPGLDTTGPRPQRGNPRPCWGGGSQADIWAWGQEWGSHSPSLAPWGVTRKCPLPCHTTQRPCSGDCGPGSLPCVLFCGFPQNNSAPHARPERNRGLFFRIPFRAGAS